MNNAMSQKTPPPRAASTVYFSMDDDWDVFAALPTPLVEVRPQMGYELHCGSGLGGEPVEVPNVVSQVVEQNVDIPVHGGMVHAMSLFPALVMGFISPAPAVSRSPAPAVENFSPAPAVFPSPQPVGKCFSPAPAVPAESTVPYVEQDRMRWRARPDCGLLLWDLRVFRYGGLQLAIPRSRHLLAAA